MDSEVPGAWEQCFTCQMAVQRYDTAEGDSVILDPRPVTAVAVPEDYRWFVRSDRLALRIGRRETPDDRVRVIHADACHGAEPQPAELRALRDRFDRDAPPAPEDVALLLPPGLAPCTGPGLRVALRTMPPRNHVLGVPCEGCRADVHELCHDGGAARAGNHRERVDRYRALRHRILPDPSQAHAGASLVACPTCSVPVARPCTERGHARASMHADRISRYLYGPWPLPRTAPGRVEPRAPRPGPSATPAPMTVDPSAALAQMRAALREGIARQRRAVNSFRDGTRSGSDSGEGAE